MSKAVKFKTKDCRTLVIDDEIIVIDRTLLASYIGELMLGQFRHVKKIVNGLASSDSRIPDDAIDLAINRLASDDVYRRDGWLFQLISWVALLEQYRGENFHPAPPHDAPSKHGFDGFAVVIDKERQISVVLTEDKCTTNHRKEISDIWNEFSNLESGQFYNKIVSQISAILENVEGGAILEENNNNVYEKSRWKYRVVINRDDKHDSTEQRRKLFKGYDNCVRGDDPHRRFASTLHNNDIRTWMSDLSDEIVKYLKSKKHHNV